MRGLRERQRRYGVSFRNVGPRIYVEHANCVSTILILLTLVHTGTHWHPGKDLQTGKVDGKSYTLSIFQLRKTTIADPDTSSRAFKHGQSQEFYWSCVRT